MPSRKPLPIAYPLRTVIDKHTRNEVYHERSPSHVSLAGDGATAIAIGDARARRWDVQLPSRSRSPTSQPCPLPAQAVTTDSCIGRYDAGEAEVANAGQTDLRSRDPAPDSRWK